MISITVKYDVIKTVREAGDSVHAGACDSLPIPHTILNIYILFLIKC